MLKLIFMIIALALALFISICLARCLYQTNTDDILYQLQHNADSYTNEKISKRLKQNGFADKLTPYSFRMIQYLSVLIIFMMGLLLEVSLLWSIVIAALGFWLPNIYCIYHSWKENRVMLSDIEHLFNLFYLQQDAGAFFMDSLTDSYRVVRYWRLKKSLMELVAKVNSKASIMDATEEFADKFNNAHISKLAEIIRHGVMDGDISVMLKDVTGQIMSIQQAQYVLEEKKQEVENLIVMTLLFCGVVVAVLYLGLLSAGQYSLF